MRKYWIHSLHNFIFQRNKALARVYFLTYGWMAMPLAVFALFFATVYIYLVFTAIRSRRVSRKYYVLLLNRAIGDTFSCTSAIAIAFYVMRSSTVKWVPFLHLSLNNPIRLLKWGLTFLFTVICMVWAHGWKLSLFSMTESQNAVDKRFQCNWVLFHVLRELWNPQNIRFFHLVTKNTKENHKSWFWMHSSPQTNNATLSSNYWCF